MPRDNSKGRSSERRGRERSNSSGKSFSSGRSSGKGKRSSESPKSLGSSKKFSSASKGSYSRPDEGSSKPRRNSYRKGDDSSQGTEGSKRFNSGSKGSYSKRGEGSSKPRRSSYGKAGGSSETSRSTASSKRFSSGSKGDFSSRGGEGSFKPRRSSYGKASDGSSERTRRTGDSKRFNSSSKRSYTRRDEESSESRRTSYGKRSNSAPESARSTGGSKRFSSGSKGNSIRKDEGSRPVRKSYGNDGSSSKRKSSDSGSSFTRGSSSKSYKKFEGNDDAKSTQRENGRSGGERKGSFARGKTRYNKDGRNKNTDLQSDAPAQTEKIRLNKFIANSGVCSRREADDLITMGLISVNGKTITELGFKVNPGDEIRYESKVLKAEKPVYILLNKPKGYITTTEDPQERNTVMQIIGGAVRERIYPVGRLDRNTTGLLLLTNDGDLADKLMHPSYNAKKIYKVELDRPLTKADYQAIIEGIRLEEGKAVVDDLAIVSEDGKTVGIELHIGWNRVVRRIFESLNYQVVKLDRSVYAGLDKKDLPRGHWRHLTKEELVRLKHYK